MKKLFTLSMLAVMAQATMALDLTTDEPIMNPQGTVVNDLIRSASTFFFGEYGFDYDANKTGMPGEYVLGDDGCIYIKEPVSGYEFGTYLKLDKVDDETYVAHTLQVAAVSAALEPVFVVRLAFSQISETSYTYQVETDELGNEITDIYFTFKDGNLEQRDRRTVDMNGVIYPMEIIALCNSTDGGWNGYGDGLLSLKKATTDQLLTPPADAEIKPATLTYTSIYDYNGYISTEAVATQMAEAGDKLFIANPASDMESWWVGTIDREAETVTFEPQYLGASSESHQWLVPATYNDYFDMIDEEDNYGLWYRNKTAVEACVMSYKNGVLTAGEAQALVVSGNETTEKDLKAFCSLMVKPGVAKANAKPAAADIQRFSPFDDFWWEGSITYFAAPLDTKGYALDANDLYVNVYHDGVTTPYTFTYSDSYDLEGPTTDIPYDYAGDSFRVNGSYHRFYFYNNWSNVGIQLVYRHEGNETRSDIVYADGTVVASDSEDATYEETTSLQTIGAGMMVDGKRIVNGRLIIRKNGVDYNVNGNLVK